MMEVVYVGTSDYRVLGEADFKKMGADHKKTISFPKGQALEVSNEVGQALLGHELVAGQFVAYQEGDEAVQRAQRDAQPQDSSGLLTNIGDDSNPGTGEGQDDPQTEGGGGGTTSGRATASASTPTGAARTTSGKSGTGRGR
jgi:hypothetical protein